MKRLETHNAPMYSMSVWLPSNSATSDCSDFLDLVSDALSSTNVKPASYGRDTDVRERERGREREGERVRERGREREREREMERERERGARERKSETERDRERDREVREERHQVQMWG